MSNTYTTKVYKTAFLKKIAALNEECFPIEDQETYSDLDYLEANDLEFITITSGGKLAGYIIYRECNRHLESVRRGVAAEFRSKGLGKKLAKKLIKIANTKKKDIYTYIATYNLASLNSNIRVGYTIDAITPEWVYVRYKVK